MLADVLRDKYGTLRGTHAAVAVLKRVDEMEATAAAARKGASRLPPALTSPLATAAAAAGAVEGSKFAHFELEESPVQRYTKIGNNGYGFINWMQNNCDHWKVVGGAPSGGGGGGDTEVAASPAEVHGGGVTPLSDGSLAHGGRLRDGRGTPHGGGGDIMGHHHRADSEGSYAAAQRREKQLQIAESLDPVANADYDRCAAACCWWSNGVSAPHGAHTHSTCRCAGMSPSSTRLRALRAARSSSASSRFCARCVQPVSDSSSSVRYACWPASDA
jgi:hypothetical protein